MTFDLQRFGGGGQTSESTYTPTLYELALQNYQATAAGYMFPNVVDLNNTAKGYFDQTKGALGGALNAIPAQADAALARQSRALDGLESQAVENSLAAQNPNNVLSNTAQAMMDVAQTTGAQNAGLADFLGNTHEITTNQMNDLYQGLQDNTLATNDILRQYIPENANAANAANDYVKDAMASNAKATGDYTGTLEDISASNTDVTNSANN